MRLDTAAGLLLGTAADAVFGDMRRYHPVAGFGRVASAVERRYYADSRARGACFAAGLIGAVAGAGIAVRSVTRHRPVLRCAVIATATWSVLGGRTLRGEARRIHHSLHLGDTAAARARLPHLVGRDPSGLDETEITRATIESVAENTSDAVVAPLFWGALAGLPGLVGYRAVNTLDAMVGHRSPHYRRFGWAAARLDDVANLAPARLTAVAVAALQSRPRDTWRRTRVWARRHPSPNSGWCEAAYAAALGIRLGGRNVYAGNVEERPRLGSGRPPVPADLLPAARLCGRVTTLAAVLAAAAAGGSVRWPARGGLR